MTDVAEVRIRFYGEGRTDVGESASMVDVATGGVIPTLVQKLCGNPPELIAVCRRLPHLQQRGYAAKVRFAKRQTRVTGTERGMVFVVDTDGDMTRLDQLVTGREADPEPFPAAVGVAHPCLESWVLADVRAIAQGLNLSHVPEQSPSPEQLDHRHHRRNHPKRILASYSADNRQDLTPDEKVAVARHMDDLGLAEKRCPKSLKPFTDEVREHLAPLFGRAKQWT